MEKIIGIDEAMEKMEAIYNETFTLKLEFKPLSSFSTYGSCVPCRRMGYFNIIDPRVATRFNPFETSRNFYVDRVTPHQQARRLAKRMGLKVKSERYERVFDTRGKSSDFYIFEVANDRN